MSSAELTMMSPASAKDDATRLDAPFAVFNIELTNRCPFKCIMCARTKNMTRAQGLMDFDLFRKVIDEFIGVNPIYATRNDVWLHHFGESLVHPEFDRFVAYASARGICSSLSVNPLMLKRETALALLRARPSKLYMSLDGHDDQSFERIRGVKDAYEKSKHNLLDFLELKRRMKSKTQILLSMIHFDMNLESIEKVRAFWENIEGIDAFLDKEFVTWDGNAEDVSRLRSDAPRSAKDRVTCGFPWEKMTVTWDGDVVPCCYDYNKKYVLGNVREQTLAEIWNGPAMRRLRQEFLDNHVTNPLCRNCEYLRA